MCSIDCCVLSFLKCKLTLLVLQKIIVNASLFFSKEPIAIYHLLLPTMNKAQINE